MDLDLPDLVDDKLFNGVLEDTELWACSDRKLDAMDESLTGFLDLESNFSADDFMKQLPDDLELPMLHDGDLLNTALEGIPLDDAHSSDSSDSGIDSGFHGGLVKAEPLSPTSSQCSELSQDFTLPVSIATGNPSPPPEGITIVKHEIPDIVHVTGAVKSTTGNVRPLHANSLLGNSNHSNVTVVKMEGPLTPPVTPTSSHIADADSQSKAIESGGSGAVPMKMVTVPGEGGTVVKMLVPAQIKSEPLTTIRPGVTKLSTGGIIKPAPIIQPKSGPSVGASKTLVLTTEEFAKLTSQKLLNLKNGTSLQPVVTTGGGTSPAYTVKAPPVVSSTVKPSISCLPQTDADLKSVKRQQRMMKNRESACLSRKRKKEYMSTLEDRLKEYSCENNKLKNENESLRKTIDVLKTENEKLKRVVPSSAYKQTTVLLGVLLLLSLNLGPFMSILDRQSPTDSLNQQARAEFSQGAVHHGRTLMSFDYDYSDGADTLDNLKMLDADWARLKSSLHLERDDLPSSGSSRSTGLMLARGIEALTRPAICPTYFNSTESQRLLNDLRGWVKGHEEQLKREQEVKNHATEDEALRLKRKKSRQARKKRPAPQKLRGSVSTEFVNVASDSPGPAYEVQMFTGAEQKYQNFMKSLQRRNDTFYVVSFRRDHMLLPATAHNKTMRPRMSVVMPAMGLNESMSTPDGSISMMQIDCEVTATRLVHIAKSVVPEHLDPNVTRQAPGNTADGREHYGRDWTQEDLGSLH